MRNLIFVLLTAATVACQTANSSTSSKIDKANPFSGAYLVKLDTEALEAELDSSDAGERFVLSLLSPLKIEAHFSESGYVKFDGAFGFMDFGGQAQQDSIPFMVEGNKLFIDKMDVNGKDYFTWKINAENQVELFADEKTFILERIAAE